MWLAEGVWLRRGLLTEAECELWVRGAYSARCDWTPNFGGVQFTLGRAFYTHLEEDRTEEYFADAQASDERVELALPGLQRRVHGLLSEMVGASVEPRSGWCGPGLHVFPAGGCLSKAGGDIHFDTEGLLGEHLGEHSLEARPPALSAIVMLQPPARGGGLRVWDVVYDGDDEVPALGEIPSLTVEYGVGDLVAIDSYRLHQIQPFSGETDRVSATAHLVRIDGRWQVWF